MALSEKRLPPNSMLSWPFGSTTCPNGPQQSHVHFFGLGLSPSANFHGKLTAISGRILPK